MLKRAVGRALLALADWLEVLRPRDLVLPAAALLACLGLLAYALWPKPPDLASERAPMPLPQASEADKAAPRTLEEALADARSQAMRQMRETPPGGLERPSPELERAIAETAARSEAEERQADAPEPGPAEAEPLAAAPDAAGEAEPSPPAVADEPATPDAEPSLPIEIARTPLTPPAPPRGDANLEPLPPIFGPALPGDGVPAWSSALQDPTVDDAEQPQAPPTPPPPGLRSRGADGGGLSLPLDESRAAAGEQGPAAPDPILGPDGEAPALALVIDDMGYSWDALERLQAMDGTLTLAFLPFPQAAPAMSAAAKRGGAEVWLHMPMEARANGRDASGVVQATGPGALQVGLAGAELRRRLVAALGRVEGAVGVNNHTGSRFTEDKTGMGTVADELAARGLAFLDSFTSPRSVALARARAAGVPATRRDVFLDHDDDIGAIRSRLADLEAVLRAKGTAVAIGHPRGNTLAALEEWLPHARAAGVRVVGLSEVIEQRACQADPGSCAPAGLRLVNYEAVEPAGVALP